MSYFEGDPLIWAANLRDSNSPLLENLPEFYYNQQRIRNIQVKRPASPLDDPIDIDLFRIKQKDKYSRYSSTYNQGFYVENKRYLSEEKKKGICFFCKQLGHLQFNCLNRKRPKSVKFVNKLKKIVIMYLQLNLEESE